MNSNPFTLLMLTQDKQTNFDFLNQLAADGILKQLLSRGLLPLKVSFHFEIFLQVRAEMKAGYKKRQAVMRVSDRLDVHEQTVWNALRSMGKV